MSMSNPTPPHSLTFSSGISLLLLRTGSANIKKMVQELKEWTWPLGRRSTGYEITLLGLRSCGWFWLFYRLVYSSGRTLPVLTKNKIKLKEWTCELRHSWREGNKCPDFISRNGGGRTSGSNQKSCSGETEPQLVLCNSFFFFFWGHEMLRKCEISPIRLLMRRLFVVSSLSWDCLNQTSHAWDGSFVISNSLMNRTNCFVRIERGEAWIDSS